MTRRCVPVTLKPRLHVIVRHLRVVADEVSLERVPRAVPVDPFPLVDILRLSIASPASTGPIGAANDRKTSPIARARDADADARPRAKRARDARRQRGRRWRRHDHPSRAIDARADSERPGRTRRRPRDALARSRASLATGSTRVAHSRLSRVRVGSQLSRTSLSDDESRFETTHRTRPTHRRASSPRARAMVNDKNLCARFAQVNAELARANTKVRARGRTTRVDGRVGANFVRERPTREARSRARGGGRGGARIPFRSRRDGGRLTTRDGRRGNSFGRTRLSRNFERNAPRRARARCPPRFRSFGRRWRRRNSCG